MSAICIFWRYAQGAKRNGARLVCIDPRRTETADKCHEHIALLPRTDAALALALMHELVQHNWLDHDYIDRHTVGWKALQWPHERAAATCGISAQQIRYLARDYGTIQPATRRLNSGVQRGRGGGNAARAIACLSALVGAWRHRAGGLLLSSSGMFLVQRAALQRPDLMPQSHRCTVNMSTIGDDLLHGTSPDFSPQIEALVVYNSNSVAVAPKFDKVVRGFARENLFTVVLEHFLTDTADDADYEMPATTQLAHWDVHLSYGHTDVLLNRPAAAPVGEARPNTQVLRVLAQRMGLHDPCFADSDEQLCRQAFGTHIDFERWLAQGFFPVGGPDAAFADGRFPALSGRCELVSARLAVQGLDGLPDYLAPVEAAGASPLYPLAIISPPARNFLNSTFANVISLRDLETRPVLEVNEADAVARGIKTNHLVRIFNDRGRYHATR